MRISENLKSARKASGLTQAAVAAHLGVSNTTLSNWENDVSRPDVDTLRVLCKLYGIRPNDIYEWGLSDTENRLLATKIAQREDLKELFLLAEQADENEIQLVTDLLRRLLNS